MRLGCDISNLCNRFGDENVFRLFRQIGFDCIDYSFNEIKPLDRILGGDYQTTARQFRAALDAVGLVCNQAHAPFLFTYGEKMDCSESHYWEVVRSMEFAAIMGAPRMIVHAVTTPEDVDIYEYNREFYLSFLPYCEKFGIKIAVENIARAHEEGDALIPVWNSPEALCDFVRSLNSPWFCVCVDIGHAAIMNCPPEEYLSRVDAQLLEGLHVHDTDLVNDCHALPYLQKQNWDAIVEALADIGYVGDFNLEVLLYTERFPDELVKPALCLAHDVGRYLVRKFENY